MAGLLGGGRAAAREQAAMAQAQAAKPKPVAPMPDEQSPAVLEAKRRAALLRRGGRSSTILTGEPSKDDSYSGTQLGA